MYSNRQQSDPAIKLAAHRIFPVFADIALALHFAAGAFWWWLSPKGFELDTSQFWTNTVLPFLVMAVATLGLVAIHFRRYAQAKAAVYGFAAAWLTAAITGRIVFPVSLGWSWLLMLAASLAGWILGGLLRRQSTDGSSLAFTASLAGALVGFLVIYWQIPPPPSTHPWSADVTAATASPTAPATDPIVNPAGFTLHPGVEQVTFDCGRLHVSCTPLLDFDRISPDRFWSLFAPKVAQTIRRYTGAITVDGETWFWYSDGARIVVSEQDSDTMTLITYSPLERAAYSHLNSYCRIDLNGHRSLALSFSPCPDLTFDVLPADYPFGRPARFAYLDESGKFHVCEATSGEKGPFRELASGRLPRGEPLEISFHEDGQRVGGITLDDWSAQLSTAISPSAGWGVPVNAIEFQRLMDEPTSECCIWITLAATSVGRGFETVGHRAGTYRNRLTFQCESTLPE